MIECPICNTKVLIDVRTSKLSCGHDFTHLIAKINMLKTVCYKYQGMLAEKDAIIRELDPTVTGWDVMNQKVKRK